MKLIAAVLVMLSAFGGFVAPPPSLPGCSQGAMIEHPSAHVVIEYWRDNGTVCEVGLYRDGEYLVFLEDTPGVVSGLRTHYTEIYPGDAEIVWIYAGHPYKLIFPFAPVAYDLRRGR